MVFGDNPVIGRIKKAILAVAFVARALIFFMPISVAALIGLYFAFTLLINQNENTISITNYAFAIVAVLSNISFSYARCVDDNKEMRAQLQYCGEKFLNSAIQFLIASIVKYFFIHANLLTYKTNSIFLLILIAIVGAIPGGLFIGSIINVIAGLRELNKVLAARRNPREDLSRFF